MANSVLQKMATPRYNKSIIRAGTDDTYTNHICTLTAISHGGGQAAKLVLPLPNQIASSTSTSWEQSDAGLLSFVGQSNKTAAETAKEMLDAGVPEIDRKAIEMMMNGILGDGGDKAYQKRTGLLINPAKENYFRGGEFRGIQLSFILVPVSKKETEKFKEMIKTLQMYSVPSVPSGNFGRIMKYPASWKIAFNPGEYLPHFKESVLTNMTVDYTSVGRPHLHEGGGPVQMNLMLNFTELTILTKEDVQDGKSFG